MLKTIKLINFRNYDFCEVNFQKGINFLVGDNGQGKTNLLEAIYFVSLLRSFRTNKITNLKQWKSEDFHIFAQCSRSDETDFTLSISYGKERKLKVNDVPVYKASEFISRFICTTFIPEDLEIVKGTAALRRRFLDIAISQSSEAYLKNLQQYNEALKSRNIMLKKQDKYSRNTITAYDYMLAEKGVQIEQERNEFVNKMNMALLEQSEIFFEKYKTISLKYISGIFQKVKLPPSIEDDPKEIYLNILKKSYERDCFEGNTRYGPHRSELNCLLNDKFLQAFGSEGECRIAALAIRFACLKILQMEIKSQKITVIVDDVLGELDKEKRKKFLQQLQQCEQVIFANTDVPEEISENVSIFQIEGGKVVASG